MLKGGSLFGTGFHTSEAGRRSRPFRNTLWDTLPGRTVVNLRTVFSGNLTREQGKETSKSVKSSTLPVHVHRWEVVSMAWTGRGAPTGGTREGYMGGCTYPGVSGRHIAQGCQGSREAGRGAREAGRGAREAVLRVQEGLRECFKPVLRVQEGLRRCLSLF